jgi:hypothetical protein
MKRRRRESFEAQVHEIREELLRLGVCDRTRPANDRSSGNSDHALAPIEWMVAAHELAGYVVATLALDRSIPQAIVLEDDAKYDLGRCSSSDLNTIWAVGSLAAERSRNEGCLGEPGLIEIAVKIEHDVGGAIENQTPEEILQENWNDIARIARLLINKGTLSRGDIETELFEPDEGEK